MGCFAFYNGFIYNECFAIPIDFFGSCYSEEPGYYDTAPGANKTGEFYWRRTSFDCVYSFGLDPRWT
jgi:V-type H+-transporting ATPase subunit a